MTRDLAGALGPQDHILLEVDHGDLGESRNSAVKAASGRYVGFLDADDLWGVDWLTRATQAAEARPDRIVWHPEVCVFFSGTRHLLHHVDMEGPAFRPTAMMQQNYWTALSFARRDIYAATPYPTTDLKEGFGFEDWSWNMLTIGQGVIHKIVPGTGHIIRRRIDDSLSKQTVSARAVPRPSAYLRQYVGANAKASRSQTDRNGVPTVGRDGQEMA